MPLFWKGKKILWLYLLLKNHTFTTCMPASRHTSGYLHIWCESQSQKECFDRGDLLLKTVRHTLRFIVARLL